MENIGSIKMFRGNPVELELFLERMDQIYTQIMVSCFGEIMERNIFGFFLSRIDVPVLLYIEATFSSTWDEV